jgi:hypothetical protein
MQEHQYSQQANKIDIELMIKNSKLTGAETITYYNNSPDSLDICGYS